MKAGVWLAPTGKPNILCLRLFYYRPQRSCGKVMFSQASVILFTGGVWQTLPPPSEQTPLADPPPGQTPPPRADTLKGTHFPGQTSPLGRHPPGRHPTSADIPWAEILPPRDGYCSGQYASYWNPFLFTYFI